MLRLKVIVSFFAFLAIYGSMQAGGFVAYSTAKIFDIHGDTSYLEVDIKVPANSLKFSLANMKGYSAKIKIYIGIYQNDKVVYADKYILNSPIIENKLNNNFNILDARRVKLSPGDYSLELFLQDANDTSQHAFMRKNITMPSPNNDIHFSDIIMLDSVYPAKESGVFTRLNYDMLPAVLDFIPPQSNNLFFYTEIYNSQLYAKNDMVQVHYSILANNKPGLSEAADSFIHTYSHVKTKSAGNVVYLFDGIDVKNLPSGEYFLQLQVLNDSQKVIAYQIMPFVRRKNGALCVSNLSHSFVDSLGYKYITDYYKYLYADETTDENDDYYRLQSKKDTSGVKAWFYQYWNVRNPQNPYQAYKDYNKLVAYCQENCKSPISPGYKSDMGRICLRYGIPDHVVNSEQEPVAYEYQIWRYDFARRQTNIHFVFYNPSQVPYDYVLLNSDAIGESKNPKWKEFIYRRTNTDTDLDHDTMPKGVGNQLDNLMKE